MTNVRVKLQYHANCLFSIPKHGSFHISKYAINDVNYCATARLIPGVLELQFSKTELLIIKFEC